MYPIKKLFYSILIFVNKGHIVYKAVHTELLEWSQMGASKGNLSNGPNLL